MLKIEILKILPYTMTPQSIYGVKATPYLLHKFLFNNMMLKQNNIFREYCCKKRIENHYYYNKISQFWGFEFLISTFQFYVFLIVVF